MSTPQRLFIFDGFDDAQRREWLTSIKEAKLRRTGKGSGVSAPSTSSHFPFEKEEGGPFARHGAGTGTGSSRATMLVAVSEVRRPWDWGVQEVVGWARTLPLTEVAQEVLLALLEGGHVDGETLVEELITYRSTPPFRPHPPGRRIGLSSGCPLMPAPTCTNSSLRLTWSGSPPPPNPPLPP